MYSTMKGQELKRLRTGTLRMTQAQLATAIGLTATSIARMERGEQVITLTSELALRYLISMVKKTRRGKKR